MLSFRRHKHSRSYLNPSYMYLSDIFMECLRHSSPSDGDVCRDVLIEFRPSVDRELRLYFYARCNGRSPPLLLRFILPAQHGCVYCLCHVDRARHARRAPVFRVVVVPRKPRARHSRLANIVPLDTRTRRRTL